MPGEGDQLGPGHGGRRRLPAAQRDERVVLPVEDQERHADAAQPLGPVR